MTPRTHGVLAAILTAITLTLIGCGSSDGGDPAATRTATPQPTPTPLPTVLYVTLNPPEAQSSDFTSLTGIRGVDNSSDVYITGGLSTSSGTWSDQLYKGPILGGGTYFTMNYPASVSTNAYSVDNHGADIQMTGTYQTSMGGPQNGFLYTGPVVNNPSTGWDTINFPGAAETNPHSIMGDIVVGGFHDEDDTPVDGSKFIRAFIYKVSTQEFTELRLDPSYISTSAYGVWWNGGNSYTIVGGYIGPDAELSSGYVLDYDSSTGLFSHVTSYKFNNAPAVSTHFEGITTDDAGGYDLAGEGVANGSVLVGMARIERTASNGFTSATWATITYPGASTTTSDTVYRNYILGVFAPGPTQLNGFAARIPSSLLE